MFSMHHASHQGWKMQALKTVHYLLKKFRCDLLAFTFEIVLVEFISVGSHLAQKSCLKAHDCSLLYMCACQDQMAY